MGSVSVDSVTGHDRFEPRRLEGAAPILNCYGEDAVIVPCKRLACDWLAMLHMVTS